MAVPPLVPGAGDFSLTLERKDRGAFHPGHAVKSLEQFVASALPLAQSPVKAA
jgi:hypothetical protein